jgi:hypothetical protein
MKLKKSAAPVNQRGRAEIQRLVTDFGVYPKTAKDIIHQENKPRRRDKKDNPFYVEDLYWG